MFNAFERKTQQKNCFIFPLIFFLFNLLINRLYALFKSNWRKNLEYESSPSLNNIWNIQYCDILNIRWPMCCNLQKIDDTTSYNILYLMAVADLATILHTAPFKHCYNAHTEERMERASAKTMSQKITWPGMLKKKRIKLTMKIKKKVTKYWSELQCWHQKRRRKYEKLVRSTWQNVNMR